VLLPCLVLGRHAHFQTILTPRVTHAVGRRFYNVFDERAGEAKRSIVFDMRRFRVKFCQRPIAQERLNDEIPLLQSLAPRDVLQRRSNASAGVGRILRGVITSCLGIKISADPFEPLAGPRKAYGVRDLVESEIFSSGAPVALKHFLNDDDHVGAVAWRAGGFDVDNRTADRGVAFLRIAYEVIISGGIKSVPMLKCCSDRSVCGTQSSSAGTFASPKLSVSIRKLLGGAALAAGSLDDAGFDISRLFKKISLRW
jgi:hypothetical protein